MRQFKSRKGQEHQKMAFHFTSKNSLHAHSFKLKYIIPFPFIFFRLILVLSIIFYCLLVVALFLYFKQRLLILLLLIPPVFMILFTNLNSPL
jgi:hypothetical protein